VHTIVSLVCTNVNPLKIWTPAFLLRPRIFAHKLIITDQWSGSQHTQRQYAVNGFPFSEKSHQASFVADQESILRSTVHCSDAMRPGCFVKIEDHGSGASHLYSSFQHSKSSTGLHYLHSVNILVAPGSSAKVRRLHSNAGQERLRLQYPLLSGWSVC